MDDKTTAPGSGTFCGWLDDFFRQNGNLPLLLDKNTAGCIAFVREYAAQAKCPYIWADVKGMQSAAELSCVLWQQAISIYGWVRFARQLRRAGLGRSCHVRNPEELLDATFGILSALAGGGRLLVVINGCEEMRFFNEPVMPVWVSRIVNAWRFKLIAVTYDRTRDCQIEAFMARQKAEEEPAERAEDRARNRRARSYTEMLKDFRADRSDMN
jgi:hypothetical protein